MAKKLGILDYIYYGVVLKVKSITEIGGNRVRVEFKPIYCTGTLSDLKNSTVVYTGYRTNKGLFDFQYKVDSNIATYALSLKDRIGENIFTTQRLMVEKPGRK